MRADAIFLDLGELAVDLAQRLPQGVHELLDCLVTAVEVELCRLLELAKRRPGEIEKRLIVLPQRVGRERRKRIPKFDFGVFEESQFFTGAPALGGELGLEPGAGCGKLGPDLSPSDGDFPIRSRPHDEPDTGGEQQSHSADEEIRERHDRRSLGESARRVPVEPWVLSKTWT
jgi:hypothetical protein